MRIFLTGISPHLFVAKSRICSVIWDIINSFSEDHIGAFFHLAPEHSVGRSLPLPFGSSAAVNFGALSEKAKPDIVVSVGDDSDASHVAATLLVGMSSFYWIHVLTDGVSYKKRPYESIIDADLVIALGDHAANQADRSGCRQVISVCPCSPVMDVKPQNRNPNRNYVAFLRNEDESNLEYLFSEWQESGLHKLGWEFVLATNGGDPGDYDVSASRLPLGMRHAWAASSIAASVSDNYVSQLISDSWCMVDCSTNISTSLVSHEAAHLGVGSICTSSGASYGSDDSIKLKSTEFWSSKGSIYYIPQRGELARILLETSKEIPQAQVSGLPSLKKIIQESLYGRKERKLQVTV